MAREVAHREEVRMTIAIRKPAMGSAATAFLAKKQQMLIDGKWVDARSGKTFRSKTPPPRR
jgi:phenylacetaldehyde dehydrogenase